MPRTTASRLCFALCVAGLVGLVGGFCAAPAYAQSRTMARIEITALLRGANVSESCMGIATDSRTSQMVALEPGNGALSADAPPGMYDVIIFLMTEDSADEGYIVMPFTITVAAGELLRRTVTFTNLASGGTNPETGEPEPPGEDGKPPGKPPPGDGGSGAGSDAGDDSTGGEPAWDDWPLYDGDDADDGPDQDVPGEPAPQGRVWMQWWANVSATYTFSEVGDRSAPSVRSVADNFQMALSGLSRWDVVGVSGRILDLREVSHDIEQTYSGGGHESFSQTSTIWVGKGPKEVTDTTNTEWTYTRRAHDPKVPPDVLISLNGWYQVSTLHMSANLMGMQYSGHSVTSGEGYNGPYSYSESFSDVLAVGGAAQAAFGVVEEAGWDAGFRQQLAWGHNLSSTSGTLFLDGSATYRSEGAEFSLSFRLVYIPKQLEAVMLPRPGFGDWLPRGSREENTPGNNVIIDTILRLKDDPASPSAMRVRYRYELVDTSRERGVCLNKPGLDLGAASGGALETPDYDMKISAENNPHLEVSDDGQTAVTKADSIDEACPSAGWVWIDSFDWGGYTRLKATAILDGGAEIIAYVDGNKGQTELTLPLDENGNHVADAWEKQTGVFGRNLPAAWDESPQPEGQRASGDGISLYEKYRGFYCSKLDAGSLGASGVAHERLDPNYKHLFVCDEGGILGSIVCDPVAQAAALSFEGLSGLRIRLVFGDGWTGPGSVGDARRIVNFNNGDDTNATEQTALHIAVSDDERLIPPEWRTFWEAHTGKPLSVDIFDTWMYSSGFSFPDIGGGQIGSPKRTYQISISLGFLERNLKKDAANHVRGQDWVAEERRRIEEDFQRWKREHPRTYEDLHPGSGESAEFLEAYEARKAQRDAEEKALEERIMEVVEDYIAAHPDEWQRRRAIEIAYVVAHELGHGVGISHHPDDSGNAMCVMTVFYCDTRTDPYDLLDAKQLDKIPNRICPSCMQRIVVSDGKG